jgi:hypothetical protein
MLDATLLPDAVLTASSSPVAVLRAYENLIAVGASAKSWRALADRLRFAASQCQPVFAVKYMYRAVDCEQRAQVLDRGGVSL